MLARIFLSPISEVGSYLQIFEKLAKLVSVGVHLFYEIKVVAQKRSHHKHVNEQSWRAHDGTSEVNKSPVEFQVILRILIELDHRAHD